MDKGKRIIWMYGDIGEGILPITADKVEATLEYYVTQGVTEVDVHLMTRGGDAEESYRISDLLQKYINKYSLQISLYVDLYAASAGINILANFARVEGLSVTEILIHGTWKYITITAETTPEELAQMQEDLIKYNDRSIELYMKKTGRTRDEVVEAMLRDNGNHWMSFGEALYFGLLDGQHDRGINEELTDLYIDLAIEELESQQKVGVKSESSQQARQEVANIRQVYSNYKKLKPVK